MPGLQATNPYDSVETVLNFVRIILADYIQNASNIAGDIFADTQPYALPTVNLGWRRMQRRMALMGHQRLEPEVIITGIPVVSALLDPQGNVANVDPATQAYLSWTGFFDGVTFFPNPVLPQDLMFPIKVSERQAGTTMRFQDMHPVTDTLPSVPPGGWFSWWDWRSLPGGASEALFIKGATQARDLRIKYAGYMADIVAAPQGLAYTPVPFMRCAEALAYFTAAAFVSPREGGALKSAEYDGMGDKALNEIMALPAKQILQRANIRRIPAILGGRRGGGRR